MAASLLEGNFLGRGAREEEGLTNSGDRVRWGDGIPTPGLFGPKHKVLRQESSSSGSQTDLANRMTRADSGKAAGAGLGARGESEDGRTINPDTGNHHCGHGADTQTRNSASACNDSISAQQTL